MEFGKEDAVVFTLNAFVLFCFSDELAVALSMIDRATELNPNLSLAWTIGGWIRMAFGEHELALDHHLKALRLNPVDSLGFTMMAGIARSNFFLGRLDEARTWAERSLVDNPTYVVGLRTLAAIEALAGRPERARQAVRRIRELDPHQTLAASLSLRMLRRPEDRQKYADALRQAGLND